MTELAAPATKRTFSAPYERWLARLRAALEERGSATRAATVYAEGMGEKFKKGHLIVLSQIKAGRHKAGADWMAALNEWMAPAPSVSIVLDETADDQRMAAHADRLESRLGRDRPGRPKRRGRA